MAPGVRSKFGAPMFETEIFRKQMYWCEESTCGIVGTFRRPRSNSAPLDMIWRHHSNPAPGEVRPLTALSLPLWLSLSGIAFPLLLFMSRWLRYLLLICGAWLKPCSATCDVGNPSNNNCLTFPPNVLKALTALNLNLTIRVNKIWHGLHHRLGRRWKFPG